MVRLVEVAPGKWRVDRPPRSPARSELPLPYVISDIMPETEQVDGRFYSSKRAFRAVGRALGLVEIGTEKLKPKVRSYGDKESRRRTIKAVIDQVRR
jgi:hypothetical protein